MLIGVLSSQRKAIGVEDQQQLIYLPQVLNNVIATGETIGGQFNYYSSFQEFNLKPIIQSVSVTGTIEDDQELTITIDAINNTNYNWKNNTVQVYRGNSTYDLSPVAGEILTGDSLTFNYDVVTTDVGKALSFKAIVRTSSGTTASDACYSEYTSVVSAQSSVLDIFDRIWTSGSLISTDWNSNTGATTGKLVGSSSVGFKLSNSTGAQLITSGATPYLSFDGTDDRIFQPLGASPSQGWEVWILADVRSTSTATWWTGSNTIDFRIVSGNYNIRQGGTSRAVGAASQGLKLHRICFSGASSFLQINGGSKTYVSATPGTSLPGNNINSVMGCAHGQTGSFSNYRLYAWGIKSSAMSDSEAQDVFEYLGYT